MAATSTSIQTEIREQLVYRPALLRHAIQRRFHRMVNPEPSTLDNVVISLTSFPQRLPKLHNCIETLLSQSVRAEKVVLYLARDECSDDIIPERLLGLQGEGLEIRFVDRNVRSLKKIIYALEDFPDKVIVTCDDDKLYPINWLENLIMTAKAHPECIVCNRSRQIEFNAEGLAIPYIDWPLNKLAGPTKKILPVGVGGVVYPPGSLHRDVLDADLFLKLSPTSDDLWLKIMSLRQGTKCVQVIPVTNPYTSIPFWKGRKLSKENIWEGGNDQNWMNLLNHFDLDPAALILDE